MLDAVRYVVDSGVKWANLPVDFPPYRRVHAFARCWQVTGLLAELHDRLSDRVRDKEGRSPDSTAAIVDSQSLRAAANIPRSTSGWDGGKKGGWPQAAPGGGLPRPRLGRRGDRGERAGPRRRVPLLERLRQMYFSIRRVWAEGGYAGRLVDWAAENLHSPWRSSDAPTTPRDSWCCRAGGWWKERSAG
ncbi:transposase [Streptomyces sp. NPDC088194]|uniref:transposase n=1 Tax=Streptomyces sp. NPDC088194 TaxID=3154931 RepID=UPI00344B6841